MMTRNATGTHIVTFLLLFASNGLNVVNASEKRDVPDGLFGIELGGRYALWPKDEARPDGIPVKKAISWKRFLGAGIHFYVEPMQTYSAFKYKEREPSTEGAPTESNFRLYLLPEIPAAIGSYEKFDGRELLWEVVSIEWRGELTDKDAYSWAMNMCESFILDMKVEPEILDSRDDDWYQMQVCGR